jgi:hypothetical protein
MAADQVTELVADLRRLVLEIEKSQKEKKKGDQQDKDKKEARPIEGQIRAREPDMVLASKLKNAVVYAPDETEIGDVNDLIIKADGKVEGVVVAVNGGEKNVALKLERFKVTPEPDGRARLVLSAKMEELQQAPGFNFKAMEEKQEQTRGKQEQKAGS